MGGANRLDQAQMKVLIGLTCCAVLAAVGYYFWIQYQEAQLRAQREAYRAYRQECLELVYQRKLMTDEEEAKISWCLVNGGLTKDDLDEAIEKMRAGT
jgi:hypothetical protein